MIKTLQELKTVLKSTGYQVAYREFKDTPTFPCIAFFETSKERMLADDSVYQKTSNVRIELYTDEFRNTTAEANLETVLENNELVYSFEDVGKIKDENLYEVVYEVQLI